MNVQVYVKIDQEIEQSLGKVKLHEKTNYMDYISYIPKIWHILKNLDRSLYQALTTHFRSVLWHGK